MEFQHLPAIVMLLVLSGVLIGTGVLVFDKFGTSAGYYRTTNTTLGESLGTVTNATPVVFSKNSSTLGITCVVLAVYNTTGNQPIDATNYTYGSDCSLVAKVGAYWQSRTWSVNYTYTFNDNNTETAGVMNENKDMIGGMASTWMPLFVVLVSLAVIITMVITSFSGARRD